MGSPAPVAAKYIAGVELNGNWGISVKSTVRYVCTKVSPLKAE
jgi:hypothetical protein